MTARLLLWTVLAAWGLFALTFGALHLWIVPRIDDWRPELEHWATRAVGVPVQIGAIRAQAAPGGSGWRPSFMPGLVPAFELADVRLFDAAGREALHLPRVQASVSVHSLWQMGFEQIVVEAPVLDVRRTVQGHIEVAGLDLTGQGPADSGAADWFFSQAEFVIQKGTVRWTDDLRRQPTLALGALDFVARNGALSHQFRLDATPPPEWGERFSLLARMREPLLELGLNQTDKAPWHRWSGELYARFAKVDVSRLRGYLDLSAWQVDVHSGQGALQAWADVDKGRIAGVTADLTLRDVATRLGPRLPELALAELQGRLSASWNETGFEFTSEGLRFRTPEGETWPGGRVHLRHQVARAGQGANTSLSADRIQLSALAAVAARLPLADDSRALLDSLKPAGLVEGLDANWEGAPPVAGAAATEAAWAAPLRYRASGRVQGLALAGQARALVDNEPVLPGRPGIQGATASFELNQDGGLAHLSVANGAIDLPGVFETSLVPLTRFETDARWRIDGTRIDAWLDNVRLTNADAEGTASVHWSTSDPARSPSRSRFPGVLDLTARLSRGEATSVHRYLPLVVGPDAQRYVRDAVRGGSVGPVDFRVRGDLWDVPFNHAGSTPGDFRISAQLKAVDFDYVPPFLLEPGETAWPMLKGVNGKLVLDRGSLRLSQLDAGVEGSPSVRLSQAEVAIADLAHERVLSVSASAQGPGSEVLGFVRGSPVSGYTAHALQHTTASGSVQVGFKLRLPLQKLDDSTVQGHVLFSGNDLQITPDAPLLGQTAGTLTFSERGFNVADAQARVYGGDLRFSGGMQPDAQGHPRTRFRGQGVATAQGLRDAGMGFVSRLFTQASGSAAYSAELGFRAGEPEILVTSSLQGMALSLPEPLRKSATDALPLRYENKVVSVLADASGEVAHTDSLSVTLGPEPLPLARLHYVRDITLDEPRVLRGSLAAGLDAGETVSLPDEGVQANIRFQRIDADAWEQVFATTTGTDVRASAGAPSASAAAASHPSLGYLPSNLAVRAGELLVGGRHFSNVVVGGSREGNQWRANVDADELNGYVEYRQPSDTSAGSIYARLAHLNLAPAAAADVEQLLQQPTSMPALDIAVDDFTLSNRHLGRVEIAAQNRGTAGRAREWRLTKLNVQVPEARLVATGNWAFTDSASAGTARRTALGFKLDIEDAGALLTRFGRPGVVRGGRGQIEGNIGWVGSPMALDYPSLSGQLKADVQSGQFLKVEPGAAKLLGVLSLQALPRRFVLDFRDVFSEGFAFDFVRGDARIDHGVAYTNNLQMKGVNAAVLMEGSADITHEQQDLKVVVVPEVNAGTASLIATAINPAIGLGSFLAQFLLREPLQSATTQQFKISGSWAEPQVEKIARAEPATPAPTQGSGLK